MKRKLLLYSILIIMIMLYSSSVVHPSLSDPNSINQTTSTTYSTSTSYASSTSNPQTSTTTSTYVNTSYPYTTSVKTSVVGLPSFYFGNQDIPLGTGSMDLNFVVGNQLTTDNGPTTLTGEAGKTVFYDININVPQAKQLIQTLFPQTFDSQLLNSTNAKLFFKVITDQPDYIQFVPGFIIGDHILYNASLIFNSNNASFMAFLDSILLPKQFSVINPDDMIFLKTSVSSSTYYPCYSYYPISNGFSCPTAMSQFFNFYLNPKNFSFYLQDYNNYFNSILQYYNSSTQSSFNWNSADINYLPANVTRQVYGQNYYSYYYFEEVSVQNNSVTLSMPYQSIYGVYDESTFNYLAEPITNQNYVSLPYLSKPYSQNKTQVVQLTNGTPDGSKVVVIFSPSTYIYAYNKTITIPLNSSSSAIKIKSIDGVYAYSNYNFNGTNYFTGGSFSGDTITLGTDPGNIPLVILYQNETQQFITVNNILNDTEFNTNFAIHSFSPVQTVLGFSFVFNLHSDGWVDKMTMYENIDFNNDKIFSQNEKYQITMTYNNSLYSQTNNPLSVGDQGSYTINESQLNLNLSPEYKYFFEQVLGNSTSSLTNMVDFLSGKKLFDYTITSTDGLLNFFSANMYDPTLSPTDPNYKTPFMTDSAFSVFDGSFYQNRTLYNSSISNLYQFANFDSTGLANYYLDNFGFPNVTTNNQGYLIENTTLTNGIAKITYPSNDYSMSFYLADEYNFSLSPDQQIAKSYNGYISQNTTDTSFYFNSYNLVNSSTLKIVAIYHPSSSLYAINGKLVLPNLPPKIYSIKAYIQSGYYGQYIDFTNQAELNGTTIFLPTLSSGIFKINLAVAQYFWDGRMVYVKQIISQPLSLLQQTGILTPLTPARTTDFFITKNNAAALNTIAGENLSSILSYIEILLNNQYLKEFFFDNLTLNGNLKFSFLINSLNDKISMINGSFSLLIPLKNQGLTSTIKLDLNLTLNGNIGIWTTWKENGLLKDFGITIHANLKTDPATEMFLRSLTSNILTRPTTSIVTTSDGFVFQTFILLIVLLMPIVYQRRKKIRK